MVAHCHRCSSVLEDEASFCPHCAAPQLRVVPPEETTEATAGPSHSFTRDRRSIDWRKVIQLALWIAIPMGLIAPFFFPLVIAAPIIVISLYQRHRPGLPLDGRSGFRVGAVTGLFAAYIYSFGVAGWQIFERYSLHRGNLIDQSYTQAMQQVATMSQNMAAGTDASLQQTREMLRLFMSPDGRAGMTLASTAIGAAGIVLLAGLGGMLGARLARRAAHP
jgi:hypothetical protein